MWMCHKNISQHQHMSTFEEVYRWHCKSMHAWELLPITLLCMGAPRVFQGKVCTYIVGGASKSDTI